MTSHYLSELRSGRSTFVVGLVSTTVLCALLIAESARTSSALLSHSQELSAVDRRSGEILYLDEVLTNAARMAAVTGDATWRRTYDDAAAALDTVIAETVEIIPALGDQIQEISEANQALIAMEDQAFDLASFGQTDRARRLLFSPEYKARKAAYMAGMTEAEEIIASTRTRMVAETKERILFMGVTLVVGLAAIITIWGRLLRHTNKTIAKNEVYHGRVEKAIDHLKEQIAARMATEEQLLRYTEELERSNTDLDAFAFIASHDLKAPLRAVSNMAEWIIEDAEGILPEEPLQNLRLLAERTHRMHGLVDDLLEYSRLSRGEAPSPEPVHVEEVLRTAVGFLSTPDGFTVQVEADTPIVATPRLPLERVVQNLVDNALKHHDRHIGEVLVRAESVQDGIRITVEDDGPGIPPEHRDRVFKLFETIASGKTDSNGIGLAAVRRMAEAQGGSIDVESGPGRGTRFVVQWPCDVLDEVQSAEMASAYNLPTTAPASAAP